MVTQKRGALQPGLYLGGGGAETHNSERRVGAGGREGGEGGLYKCLANLKQREDC